MGENGAGKTTLIKLLLRLYEPTRGEILLDGRPLAEYDPEEYHREVGVIFQDFVRYDMRAEENIAVGRISALRRSPGRRRERIEDAAERSLAAGVIEGLPERYGTMLGRRFEGGVDLSGGQWQKVALARAYMRDAQVLILDEPTAALDARAEYEVFQRFADLTRGQDRHPHLAPLLHRAHGRPHPGAGGRPGAGGGEPRGADGAGGRYAELFSLQAAGYGEPVRGGVERPRRSTLLANASRASGVAAPPATWPSSIRLARPCTSDQAKVACPRTCTVPASAPSIPRTPRLERTA